MQLSRYVRWRSVDTGLVKRPTGDRNRQSRRGYQPKGGHVYTMNRAQLEISAKLTGFYSVFFALVVNFPAKVIPPQKGILPLHKQSSVCPRTGLRPRRETRYPKRNHRSSLRCLLLNPAMRHQLEYKSKSTPSVSSLVCWLVGWFEA